MAKPVEYTFWGYWGNIAMKIPQLLLHSYKNWFASINLILFLATLCNKQIAEILQRHWQGISPLWSLVFIGILVAWSIMVAIYERDKEVYSTYKASDEKLEQLQDYNFMSLKEACDAFHEDKISIFGQSSSDIEAVYRPTYLYNKYTKYFANVDTIYGYSPSGHFKERRIISEDKFIVGTIKIEEGELVLYGPGNYVGKTPEYVGLAIKKDNLKDDIEKIIINLTIPLSNIIQTLYEECQEHYLLNKFLDIYIRNISINKNDILNQLARQYAYISVFLIYGEDSYTNERKQIPKEIINNLWFADGGSSLRSSYDNELKYIKLFIKSKDHDYAIAQAKIQFGEMVQGVLKMVCEVNVAEL